MGTTSEFEEEVLNRPVIGVIATEENTDSIVRIVALARQYDHAVLVAYDGQEEPRSVHLARQLGAEAVNPEDETADSTVLRNVLSTVARVHGFPGLLFHSSPEEHIDYEEIRRMYATDSEFADSSFAASDFTTSAPTRDSTDHRSDTVIAAIPAYNEASSIGDVVRSVRTNVDTVLVVDDGSTDDTVAIAEAAGAEVIRHRENEGYGAALKTAFAEARERGAKHLVTLDGDGQHDGNDVSRLIERQEERQAHVVIGSRFADGVNTEIPLYRRFGLLVVNFLTNLSLGVVRSQSRVSDTQSGFRAYDETAIETLSEDHSLGNHMSISTDILYHAQERDYLIEEVGTVIDYDVDGGSNHNPLSHGYVLVMNLLNTIERTRPLMALALPGFVLTFVGLGFGYWGFLHYIQVNNFPVNRAAISAFLIFVGLLTCLSGIILHSLNTYFAKIPHDDRDTIYSRT